MLLHDRLSLHNWIPAHFYYFTSIHPPLFPSIYMYTHRYCASETMNYVRFLNKKNISVSSDYLEYKWAQYKAVKQMLFPYHLALPMPLCHFLCTLSFGKFLLSFTLRMLSSWEALLHSPRPTSIMALTIF